MQFELLNRYLNHAANFQLQSAIYDVWYLSQQQLQQLTNNGICRARYDGHHSQEALSRIHYLKAKVLDMAQHQLRGKIRPDLFQLVACSLG